MNGDEEHEKEQEEIELVFECHRTIRYYAREITQVQGEYWTQGWRERMLGDPEEYESCSDDEAVVRASQMKPTNFPFLHLNRFLHVIRATALHPPTRLSVMILATFIGTATTILTLRGAWSKTCTLRSRNAASRT